jgi:hypothetical protein
MALYYDLPVYRDTYQLILKIFECTKDFSKEYKYTLGQDLKKNATRKGSIFFGLRLERFAFYVNLFQDDTILSNTQFQLSSKPLSKNSH